MVTYQTYLSISLSINTSESTSSSTSTYIHIHNHSHSHSHIYIYTSFNCLQPGHQLFAPWFQSPSAVEGPEKKKNSRRFGFPWGFPTKKCRKPVLGAPGFGGKPHHFEGKHPHIQFGCICFLYCYVSGSQSVNCFCKFSFQFVLEFRIIDILYNFDLCVCIYGG